MWTMLRQSRGDRPEETQCKSAPSHTGRNRSEPRSGMPPSGVHRPAEGKRSTDHRQRKKAGLGSAEHRPAQNILPGTPRRSGFASGGHSSSPSRSSRRAQRLAPMQRAAEKHPERRRTPPPCGGNSSKRQQAPQEYRHRRQIRWSPDTAAVRAENSSMQKMMLDMQARLEALEKK